MACKAPAAMPPAIVAVSVDNTFATVVAADVVVDDAAVVIAAAMKLGTAFSCDVVDDDATNARRSLCVIER